MQTIQYPWLSEKKSKTNGYLTTAIQRPAYWATLMSVHRIVIQFSSTFQMRITIMTVMQKLKFMQEFTFALHSNLLAKLPLHNCVRAC